MTYRPQTHLTLRVNRSIVGSPDLDDTVTLNPRVLSAKWTRNNHREADVLTVTVSYKECGVDPRQLINARCAFALWDANTDDGPASRHVRFTGICKTAERKLGEGASQVELTFHDFTTLFLGMKPYPQEAMPLWGFTLREAWAKICNNTGFRDVSGNVVSSVEIFKPVSGGIVFFPPELGDTVLGNVVPERLIISRPTPPPRSDAWACWRYCCEALGLVTFIDRDQCVVSSINEFYLSDRGAALTSPVSAAFGRDIISCEEKVDVSKTEKGVHLISFDPLLGRYLEAYYPQPGDPRLKTKKSWAGKRSDGGAQVTANEAAPDYETFNWASAQTQGTLQAAAESVYAQRARQALTGKFRTAEMFLPATHGGEKVDVLELRSGAPIYVRVDPESLENLMALPSENERVAYLQGLGYPQDTARLIAKNAPSDELSNRKLHVSDLSVEIGDGKFEIEIGYHALIWIDGVNDRTA